MVALIEHTHENTDPEEAKLHWSGFYSNTYTRMQGIRLGGSEGMLPQESFRKFDALRWLLRPFLGLKKHHLEVFALVLAW